jgi:hypothetical protein
LEKILAIQNKNSHYSIKNSEKQADKKALAGSASI